MSKSSANPRRYSKGKEALNPDEILYVYLEIRLEREDLKGIDARLRYLASRRPQAVLDVAGVRRESNKYILTLSLNMGTMRAALRGTSIQEQVGYDLIWDLFEQLPEFGPIFAAPPARTDRENARALGLATQEEQEEQEEIGAPA